MKSILNKHLLSSARRLFPNQEWWLLHDNDSKHKSGIVKTWRFNNGIFSIDFPPYSPDLNPMENIWHDLKMRLEKRNSRDTEQLILHIKEEWEGTSRELLKKLSHGMKKRGQLLIVVIRLIINIQQKMFIYFIGSKARPGEGIYCWVVPSPLAPQDNGSNSFS